MRHQHRASMDSAIAATLAVCALMVCPRLAQAQVATAAINGTITDTSGAVIPGASVVLVNPNTGARRTTVSNHVGNYSFVEIEPGSYTLQVSKNGFETQRQAEFTLSVNQTATYTASPCP